MPNNTNGRELWGTRIGLILAMAGNAIGLGNFLRFPVQVAENGGGAFMVPYFISFILLGIPLMWVEWGMGRYGGVRGHGTAPAIFDSICESTMVKYLGVLGILLPLLILTYYTYICSWTLSYSISSLLGHFPTADTLASAGSASEVLKPYAQHLGDYIGDTGHYRYFDPSVTTWVFYIGTLLFGLWVLSRGIQGGIEKLNKIAIPTLFVLASILFIRIITFDSPNGASGASVADGFGFIWNPDFSGLTNPKVWLAASGQIFFTLSLGFGAVLTYASYVKKDEDIALDGLSTASLNGFAEVVFGSTIAVVSAVVFFGVSGAKEAAGGAFQLGLISMPAIFSHMPGGDFFGFLWFLLLYLAGITSFVALSQPVMCYLEDEFHWSRVKATVIYGLFLFAVSLIPILVKGALDEIDFWAGTFGIVVLALIEIVIFMWVYDSEKAWAEITGTSRIKIPRVFFYIIKYVTPTFLIAILLSWSYTLLPDVLNDTSFGKIFARIFLVSILVFSITLIAVTWKEKRDHKI